MKQTKAPISVYLDVNKTTKKNIYKKYLTDGNIGRIMRTRKGNGVLENDL